MTVLRHAFASIAVAAAFAASALAADSPAPPSAQKPAAPQTVIKAPLAKPAAVANTQAVLIGPEDCVDFDPKAVKQYGGMVRAGNKLLVNYGPNADLAKRAAYVIQMSGFDQQCFVGHLPGEMMYWKKAGHVPSGNPLQGEDCLKINPSGAYVFNTSGNWVVMAGLAPVVNTHADKAAADRAVALIKAYKFTRYCSIVRPANVMMYWLTD